MEQTEEKLAIPVCNLFKDTKSANDEEFPIKTMSSPTKYSENSPHPEPPLPVCNIFTDNNNTETKNQDVFMNALTSTEDDEMKEKSEISEIKPNIPENLNSEMFDSLALSNSIDGITLLDTKSEVSDNKDFTSSMEDIVSDSSEVLTMNIDNKKEEKIPEIKNFVQNTLNDKIDDCTDTLSEIKTNDVCTSDNNKNGNTNIGALVNEVKTDEIIHEKTITEKEINIPDPETESSSPKTSEIISKELVDPAVATREKESVPQISKTNKTTEAVASESIENVSAPTQPVDMKKDFIVGKLWYFGMF